jgi:hypothetical protein
MADQTSLHDARQRIGSKRQPTHARDLQELEDILVSLRLSHPYELAYDEKVQLETKPAFSKGGQGPTATLVGKQHLYRICGAKGLALGVTDLKLGGITHLDNDDVLWNGFNDLADPLRWRALSRYASGTLTGRRGISWWTSLRLRPSDLAVGAYQIGMYDMWIPVYALLLRCPVDFVVSKGLSLVPSVLDAFDQEVFHPTRYADNPESGITISLEHAGALKKGVSEFILGPLEVDKIEILPVLINAPARAGLKPLQQEPSTWGLLETYLETM